MSYIAFLLLVITIILPIRAVAQSPPVRLIELLQQGFEIRAATSIGDAILVYVQKGKIAYTCVPDPDSSVHSCKEVK